MKSRILLHFLMVLSLHAYEQDMTAAYAGTLDVQKLKKNWIP